MPTLDLFGNLIADDFTASLSSGSPVARDKRKVLNAGGKLVSVPRAPHPTPDVTSQGFIGPLDLRGFMVTRGKAARAAGSNELHRKSARAMGLLEGWREIANEPDRLRVGLLGREASLAARERGV